jgi:DNA replication and repair protein RecF
VPGVVLLHGPNGAGKTNLLEALHVGTQGFSPRARRDTQMIRFGTEAARITLSGSRGLNAFETDLVLTRREARTVRLNGDRLESSERLRQELTALVFTPDRLAVVKGAPATRRTYLDRVVGRLLPGRARIAGEYTSAVGQRNAALRRIRARHSTRDALAPWTEQIASLGEELVRVRVEVVGLLAPVFAELADALGLENALLTYEGAPPTIDELESRLDADIERGVTGAGPHLHDLRIEAGGRDLRVFGSQGEQRIAVLSLVLAEAELLRARTDVSPLVLLDDVLSELDGSRRSALADVIARNAQTVVTATAESALPVPAAQSLSVSPGRIE